MFLSLTVPNSLTGNRNSKSKSKSRDALAAAGILVPTWRTRVSGVSVIRAANPDPRGLLSNVLVEIYTACLHNASVADLLNETGRRDAWTLLAKAVESRLKNHQTSSGDWGRAGDALGTNLVANILRYYESFGDFQMLATMVCVLRHPGLESFPTFKVVPTGKDEAKYDVYIHRYADLLYVWGLLTVRAEVNKHLVRLPSVARPTESSYAGGNDENLHPGIALSLQCPRCRKECIGRNFCDTCKVCAFRCIICDTAVRGLFTVCDMCGHGGHVRHLTTWFASHNECPTGCGCNCVLRSAPPSSPSLPTPVVPTNV
jgi:hypothetical protein